MQRGRLFPQIASRYLWLDGSPTANPPMDCLWSTTLFRAGFNITYNAYASRAVVNPVAGTITYSWSGLPPDNPDVTLTFGLYFLARPFNWATIVFHWAGGDFLEAEIAELAGYVWYPWSARHELDPFTVTGSSPAVSWPTPILDIGGNDWSNYPPHQPTTAEMLLT